MLIYLPEINSPLVTLMPLYSIPLTYYKFRLLITPHLHSRLSRPRQTSGDVRIAHELNVSKREIHLVEVKYCADSRSGPIGGL